jgi:hypothetical protein
MSRLARGVLIFTAAGALAIAALPAAFFWLPAIGTPSNDALQYSLARTVGSDLVVNIYDCRERSESVRVCEVSDASGSGFARYRVRMDGRRCWRAVKTTSNRYEEGSDYLDLRAHGCVGFREQIRLFDRI